LIVYHVWGHHLKDEAYELGGEFLIPKYKVLFCPQHGIILDIYSNKVYHGTCRSIGYTQVGVALTTRVKIANACAKRQRDLKF
jgi:hypothetical protein